MGKPPINPERIFPVPCANSSLLVGVTFLSGSILSVASTHNNVSKLATNAIVNAVNRRNQELQQMIQEEMQHIQTYCYNPQKYWINRQQCVQESQENIAYWQQSVKQLNDRDISKAQEYQNRATELAREEAKRGGGNRTTANVSSTNTSDDYNPQQ